MKTTGILSIAVIFIMMLSPHSTDAKKRKELTDRQNWCEMAYRMAEPVLRNMSEGKLQEEMPVETSPGWGGGNTKVAYLECFGRLMDGIAPWLALPDDETGEGKMRRQLREWALKSYVHAVDPESPDYLLWREGGQPLVDAAFLAESFLRAWDALWVPLDDVTKQRYITEFTQLRRIDPPHSNWLLFSSTVECFLHKAGAEYDAYRITSAFREIEEWYTGDGWYSDGPEFRFDYYNSFVIQPMYIDCLEEFTDKGRREDWNAPDSNYEKAIKRMQRHGVILERFISPEGTFPVVGRSITYRTGAMQPLSMLAWKGWLPDELPEGQARAALTAVLSNMFGDDRNYNSEGYLILGFNGSQPEISDGYTNTGSLYLASFIFLPLGLPADDPFWTDDPLPWTSKKAWEGGRVLKDRAYRER